MKLRYCEKAVEIGDIIEISNLSFLRMHLISFPDTERYIVVATWFEEVKE